MSLASVGSHRTGKRASDEHAVRSGSMWDRPGRALRDGLDGARYRERVVAEGTHDR